MKPMFFVHMLFVFLVYLFFLMSTSVHSEIPNEIETFSEKIAKVLRQYYSTN